MQINKPLNKSQITCQEANCNLKGFWYEETAQGEKVLCFRAKHHAENHIVRLVLPDGVKELERPQLNQGD